MIETIIVVANAVRLAGAATAFGVLLFELYANIKIRAAIVLALCAIWLGQLVLLPVETANMAGDDAAGLDPSILRVALATLFGQLWLMQLVLLGLFSAIWMAKPRTMLLALGASAALAASMGLQGHAGAALAAGNWTPIVSNVVHVLAAGAWIGALVAMTCVVFARPGNVSDLSRGLSRFSKIGPAVVTLLVLTGLANLWPALQGATILSLVQSSYGAALGLKLALFTAMLLLAAAHRYVLTPRLEQPGTVQGAQKTLRASLLVETFIGAATLTAAAILAATPPPGR